MIHFNVIFSKLDFGVILGYSDTSVLDRSKDCRTHVGIVHRFIGLGKQSFRQHNTRLNRNGRQFRSSLFTDARNKEN
jgi:hypothetical protein